MISKKQRHACLQSPEKCTAYACLKYQETSDSWVQTKPYEDAPKTEMKQLTKLMTKARSEGGHAPTPR